MFRECVLEMDLKDAVKAQVDAYRACTNRIEEYISTHC